MKLFNYCAIINAYLIGEITMKVKCLIVAKLLIVFVTSLFLFACVDELETPAPVVESSIAINTISLNGSQTVEIDIIVNRWDSEALPQILTVPYIVNNSIFYELFCFTCPQSVFEKDLVSFRFTSIPNDKWCSVNGKFVEMYSVRITKEEQIFEVDCVSKPASTVTVNVDIDVEDETDLILINNNIITEQQDSSYVYINADTIFDAACPTCDLQVYDGDTFQINVDPILSGSSVPEDTTCTINGVTTKFAEFPIYNSDIDIDIVCFDNT